MTTVQRNVAANLAGKAWSAAVSLVAVPVYLHILGIEGYGIIGFFLSLSAILSLLDLGLGMALNRQLAQYSVQGGRARDMRDLVRTLEVIYWLVGLGIGIVVAAAAPWFARHWLQLGELPEAVAAQTLVLMGIAIACQWPRALYAGGLVGLQRLVMLNVIAAAFATVLNAGAVIVLWAVAPTLQAFMIWHIAISLLETVVTGVVLWRRLPAAPGRPAFSRRLLREIWRFAAGMTGISTMAVVLTQLDKVILSRLLALDAYGYYTLAWRVASGLYYLAAPITAAFFPRFTQLAALNDQRELARLYHRGTQFMSVALLPLVAMIALFPAELLLLWTRDAATAQGSSRLLAWLILGTALNGLMNLPLAVQLAHGATRLVFVTNTAAVLVLAPLLYYVTLRHGALGAAWIWCALNAGYVLILLRMMHRHILPDELRAWFILDTGIPAAAAFGAVVVLKYALPQPAGEPATIAYLFAVWLLASMATLLVTSQMRALAAHHLAGAVRRRAA
jgi:O-antigen/teichoic acid export membrane protein